MTEDLESIRRKYQEERDRRLRRDGNAQYRSVDGQLKKFVFDPYVEPGYSRAPRTDEVEIAIIGGGFGGLIAAARLTEAGQTDFLMFEKASDFGGTWYWNRYPGAQCDIESYIYLPLLEETGYIPQEKYSFQPEIFAHAQRIGEHFALYDKALLQTQVKEIRWYDEQSVWVIRTDRDDVIKARFVVMSNGPLNRPKLPALDGIESFKGHSFHTSRWDYEYTGGSAQGGLTKLADKKVGIIGTGATAIQTVPHLGAAAGSLHVFQRTPSSVDVRGNKPTDSNWASQLQPGWQASRRDNFAAVVSGVAVEEDLVADGWTDIVRNLATLVPTENSTTMSAEKGAELMERADMAKMNQIRARVDKYVSNPETAQALKPWYRQFCKRPTFNDDYLPTFNRDNVILVDTQGGGVDEITENGVMVDGVEYPLDCLIFATGFEVGTDYSQRAEFSIIGRGGRTLAEHWQDGMRTFHGFYSHGFPNCFHMGITQNGLSVNFTSMLDPQARHIAYVIQQAGVRQAQVIEPTAEAEAEWVETIKQMALGNREFFEACTPGYYNNEGKPGSGVGLADQQYGGGAVAFYQLVADWQAEGSMEGLSIR
ncbi:MAG: NAD(P)/FAD-dependent oxidoreductase [Pseudomonadota bacterium]